jgi:hypothetical protein
LLSRFELRCTVVEIGQKLYSRRSRPRRAGAVGNCRRELPAADRSKNRYWLAETQQGQHHDTVSRCEISTYGSGRCTNVPRQKRIERTFNQIDALRQGYGRDGNRWKLGSSTRVLMASCRESRYLANQHTHSSLQDLLCDSILISATNRPR